MMRRLVFFLLLFLLLPFHVYAVRSLPPGAQPVPKEGKAVGKFPELKGSGTITFTNIGGEARLVTVCDTLTDANVTCSGTDVKGTFSGGPDGEAVFDSGAGEIKIQLKDGKIFTFSAGTISMDFTVTDPSIFDAWVAEGAPLDSGARVSDLSGQVEIACPPDLEAWDVMKMGRVIYVDCHLKTGEDSNAVISFSDMTTFKMRPESEIVIDTPPEKESKLSLIAGNIWVNVKQMVKDGTMKVHMSQAVAGIKGTTFVLTETASESSIKVIEGVVSFQSKADGRIASVTAGEAVKATAAGLSKKSTFDVPTEQGVWQKNDVSIRRETGTPKNQSPAAPLAVGAGIGVLVLGVLAAIIFKSNRLADKHG